METATAVGDGKLSNEELGAIYRRTSEIVRRVNDGALTQGFVLKELQRITEGKPPEPPPQPRFERQRKREFRRPEPKLRAHSNAPYGKALPNSVQRLQFPDRNWEHLMAEMWEAENIPYQGVNHGRTHVHAILHTTEPVEHDIEVISSTLQWLATNVGSEFLRRFIQTAGMTT